MIIDCPNCGKRISSKYKACPSCGLGLGDSEEGLDLDAAAKRLRVQRTYRLQAQMYLSILLFVIGCAWLWSSSDGLASQLSTWPIALTAAGAMWYIGIRIYMIISRYRR